MPNITSRRYLMIAIAIIVVLGTQFYFLSGPYSKQTASCSLSETKPVNQQQQTTNVLSPEPVPCTKVEERKSEKTLKKSFFFSVLSVCEAKNARGMMRYWLKEKAPPSLTALYDYKFFIEKVRYFSGSETMDCVKELEEEQKEHNDLVFLDLEKSDQGWYKLVHKVEKILQYLLGEYVGEYKYFVKIDDDSLVLVEYLNDLVSLHEKSFLQRSGEWNYIKYTGKTDAEANNFILNHYPLYAGFRYTNNPVQLDGFWANRPYFESTALTTYTRYMSGGMYVLSNSLVKAIASASKASPLVKWTMEDATVGFWVTSFQSVWVHIPNIMTALSGGCKPEMAMVLYHPVKDPKCMRHAFDSALDKNWVETCAWANSGAQNGTPETKRQ